MKRYNTFLFIIAISLFLIPLISASESSFGTFKQGDCIQLLQLCSNCTYNNITSVVAPNGTQILGIASMQKIGTEYNYTFCKTDGLGTYSVNGLGDIDSVATIWNYVFEINTSGQNITQPQINLIIIGIVILIIVAIFFFALALLFKHPGTKIFLMALSAITLIFLIGIITSNASIYLSNFTGLVSTYNNYYYFIITMAGAAMIGIIIWLIYFSFKQFHMLRGLTPDE